MFSCTTCMFYFYRIWLWYLLLLYCYSIAIWNVWIADLWCKLCFRFCVMCRIAVVCFVRWCDDTVHHIMWSRKSQAQGRIACFAFRVVNTRNACHGQWRVHREVKCFMPIRYTTNIGVEVSEKWHLLATECILIVKWFSTITKTV